MTTTRQQYLDGEISHQDYYMQFVTEDTKKYLFRSISPYEILGSKDKHLNDIPLHLWDGAQLSYDKEKFIEANGKQAGFSKSDKVCILKACAHDFKNK